MNLRRSVRAVMVDEQRRVLLVNFDWPGLGIEGGFWACPGGGLEAGESDLEGLARELAEEVGFELGEASGPIWLKEDVWPFGGWDGQADAFYLVLTRHFTPLPGLSAEVLAAERVHGMRWFAPAEVEAAKVTFSPRGLPALLASLWESGVPAEPVRLSGH